MRKGNAKSILHQIVDEDALDHGIELILSDEEKTVSFDKGWIEPSEELAVLGIGEVVFLVHEKPGLVEGAIPSLGVLVGHDEAPHLGEIFGKARRREFPPNRIVFGVRFDREGLAPLEVFSDDFTGFGKGLGQLGSDQFVPILHLGKGALIRHHIRSERGGEESLAGFREEIFPGREPGEDANPLPLAGKERVKSPGIFGKEKAHRKGKKTKLSRGLERLNFLLVARYGIETVAPRKKLAFCFGHTEIP